LYVTVEEVLESTVTAEMVQPDSLVMSYGALGTVNGTAKFISSAAVGFGLAAVLMTVGTLALLRVVNDQRTKRTHDYDKISLERQAMGAHDQAGCTCGLPRATLAYRGSPRPLRWSSPPMRCHPST
jgi:hypothetical protein